MASWRRLQLPPSGRLWRSGVGRSGTEGTDAGASDQPRGLIRNEKNDGNTAKNNVDHPHEAGGENKEEEKEEISEIPEGAEELLNEEVAKLAAKVESEWEILSDASSGGTTIIISKTGSVRSLPSTAGKLSAMTGGISQQLDLSIPSPFTLQRSLSNSTIASEDNCSFGASCHHSDIVYGIPGVDYVEHVVMPTDTLQGICLSYKVSATRLRQANQFSGNTLLLAPKKLIVPLSKNGLVAGSIRMQDRTTKKFKLQALMAEFTNMGQDEAKEYLNTSQWELDGAIRAAGEDGEWEKASVRNSKKAEKDAKSGDIHITLKVRKGGSVSAIIRGSGQRPINSSSSDGGAAPAASSSPSTSSEAESKESPSSINEAEAVVASPSPASPTTLRTEDVHKADPVHDGQGFEMQTINNSSDKKE